MIEKKRQIQEIKMRSCKDKVEKYIPKFPHLGFLEDG